MATFCATGERSRGASRMPSASYGQSPLMRPSSCRHTIRTLRHAGSSDKKHRTREHPDPRCADATSAQFSQGQADVIQARADSELAQSALARIKTELAQTQSGLASVRAELASAEISLVQARTELVEVRTKLVHTNDELTNIRRASTQVSAQLMQAHADLTQSRTKLTQACGELEAVHRSRFWRITHPWRTLDTYLRNRRGRRRKRRRRANLWAILHGADRQGQSRMRMRPVASGKQLERQRARRSSRALREKSRDC